jgi:hypothetical protein
VVRAGRVTGWGVTGDLWPRPGRIPLGGQASEEVTCEACQQAVGGNVARVVRVTRPWHHDVRVLGDLRPRRPALASTTSSPRPAAQASPTTFWSTTRRPPPSPQAVPTGSRPSPPSSGGRPVFPRPQHPKVRAAIRVGPEGNWTPVTDPRAVWDEDQGRVEPVADAATSTRPGDLDPANRVAEK